MLGSADSPIEPNISDRTSGSVAQLVPLRGAADWAGTTLSPPPGPNASLSNRGMFPMLLAYLCGVHRVRPCCGHMGAPGPAGPSRLSSAPIPSGNKMFPLSDIERQTVAPRGGRGRQRQPDASMIYQGLGLLRKSKAINLFRHFISFGEPLLGPDRL